MNLRGLRFWTAFVVTLLAVATARTAWSILGFGLAQASATQLNAVTSLTPYVERQGIGTEARKTMLRLAPPADETALVDDLDGLLTRRPLDSAAWLDLSLARHVSGDEPTRVASALAISNVTGPNESWLMTGRASFGLSLWDVLPPDLRRSVISDLVNGWPHLGERERQNLRTTVSAISSQANQQIRAALLLLGKSATPVIADLELRKPGAPDTR